MTSQRPPGGGEAYDKSTYIVTAECHPLGGLQCFARLRDGDSGLLGLGATPAEAIADLHEGRRWHEERQREAAAPAGKRFTRAVDNLLDTITRLGWEVTRQRAAFDGDSEGGTVELTLRLAGQAGDAVVTVFPPYPSPPASGTSRPPEHLNRGNT